MGGILLSSCLDRTEFDLEEITVNCSRLLQKDVFVSDSAVACLYSPMQTISRMVWAKRRPLA